MQTARLLGIVLLVASRVPPARAEPAHAEPSRPNVLMIIVDDLNDWVGCLGGHPDVRTPHIDRLAERGVLFTNAHCASPVCNPSRAATLTGRSPARTGIYSNRPVWHAVLPGVVSLPQHFRAHGYQVAGGGKVYHHAPGHNRRGDWDHYFDQVFDEPYLAQAAAGDSRQPSWPPGFPLNRLPSVAALSRPPLNPFEFDWGPWDRGDLEMGDGRMVKWAVDFLERPPAEPFFLATGIFRPHLSWYAPRPYFEQYPADRLTLPPVRSDDLDDVPATGRQLAEARRGDHDLIMQSGRYREAVQAYLASISYCDALVGFLLDALDRSPAAGRTIVILWSDHGWHLGEKRHWHKMTLWERATRVPLIVAAPGTTQMRTRSGRPVGLIDLFPTMNELCGLPALPDLDGISLVPLLRDPERSWERPALTTYRRGNHAVRSERWRYIRYADGGEELYDHQRDPHEWHNLAGDPAFDQVKRDLAVWMPKSDAPASGEEAAGGSGGNRAPTRRQKKSAGP